MVIQNIKRRNVDVVVKKFLLSYRFVPILSCFSNLTVMRPETFTCDKTQKKNKQRHLWGIADLLSNDNNKYENQGIEERRRWVWCRTGDVLLSSQRVEVHLPSSSSNGRKTFRVYPSEFKNTGIQDIHKKRTIRQTEKWSCYLKEF